MTPFSHCGPAKSGDHFGDQRDHFGDHSGPLHFTPSHQHLRRGPLRGPVQTVPLRGGPYKGTTREHRLEQETT